MRRLLPVWLCTVTLAPTACRTPQAGPAPVPLEQRVAGCYALESGPWQLDPRFTSQPVPLRLPERLQLFSTPPARRPWQEGDSVPFFAARSHVAPGEGVYWFGYWQPSEIGSDTIRISGDPRPFSIVDLRLRPEGPDLSGGIRLLLSFPGKADPQIATAPVLARRIPCPEP